MRFYKHNDKYYIIHRTIAISLFTDKDGKVKTPIMIHRALIGSPERFMGILIEHYSGNFPLSVNIDESPSFPTCMIFTPAVLSNPTLPKQTLLLLQLLLG